jgi:hypothetical protein
VTDTPTPSSGAPRSKAPTPTVTVRTPSELIAMVPHLLGFHPQESLVVVPTDRPGPIARIDLPRTPDDRQIVAHSLVTGYRASPGGVVILAFSSNEDATRAAVDVVTARSSGVLHITDSMRIHNGAWLSHTTGDRGIVNADDVSRFAADAVLRGRVMPAQSRDNLATHLRSGDPAPLGHHLAAALQASDAITGKPVELAAEARWMAMRITEFVATQQPLADRDAARMLADVQQTPLRDTALRLIEHDDASTHVALWTDLTRRAPDEAKTPAAELLGFSAWLSGDGARAWVALDQVTDIENRPLAVLIGHALTHAVPPSAWTTPVGPPDFSTADATASDRRVTLPTRRSELPAAGFSAEQTPPNR